jgi:hypothetical protein
MYVAYIALRSLSTGAEVIIHTADEDTASEIIERGVLRAFKDSRSQTKDIARDLEVLALHNIVVGRVNIPIPFLPQHRW